MVVDWLLNPLEEQVIDNFEEIVEMIAGTYSLDIEQKYETNEEDVIIPQVRDKEAQDALVILRQYEEQQEQGNMKLIKQ